MQSVLRIGLPCAILVIAAIAQNAPPAEMQQIGEAAFTVPANSFKEYPVNVPAGLKEVRVVGHFRAAGGAHNDIVVCVMSDDQFVNWRNDPIRNNPIKEYFKGALYDSHKVTQGTIKLALPTDPGTYHVVFYNGYSMLTPKAIEANLALQSSR